jgi:hypothetical protein
LSTQFLLLFPYRYGTRKKTKRPHLSVVQIVKEQSPDKTRGERSGTMAGKRNHVNNDS